MQFMEWGLKHHGRKLIACLMTSIMFFSMLALACSGNVFAKTEESAPADHFEVWLVDPADKDNKTQLLNYAIPELEQMPQVERGYSSIDSLPAPVFTAARGIDLIDFLKSHKFNMETVTGFKFRATDYDADNLPPNAGKPFKASDLLDSGRYYFPQIQACWAEYWDEDEENPSNPGLPGYWKEGSDQFTRAGQTPVRPMLGIVSYGCRAIASDPGKPVGSEPQFDLMDGTTTLKLCYGQKDPGECTTMNFLNWTYKMEVTGKLLPITLNADPSCNRVGKSIEITFPENIAWQNGITAVSVGENLLDEGQYTVAPGKITIAGDVFTEARTYTVKVTSGFQVSTIEQQITEASASDPLTPPTLIPDNIGNTPGNSIDIIFTDDATWRTAISEVKVGETVLESSKYTREAGKIAIDASVFTAAGLYTIVIKAAQYEDATLQQEILETSPEPISLQSIEIVKPAAKLAYTVGDTLETTGLEVSGHYTDGSSKLMAIGLANITGFDSSKPIDRQILTITVDEKITTYEVCISQAIKAIENATITIPDVPVTITVPDGVENTEIQVSQNSALPRVKVESSQVDMTIPNGTTVAGSDTIQLPEVKPSSSVTVPAAQTVSLVIELGSEMGTITFSKPCRLVLKGQSKKSVGFIDNAGNFREINRPASLTGLTGEGDIDAVAAVLDKEGMQEGAADCGKDIIIWTKHFTRFVAYKTSTNVPVIIAPQLFIEEFFVVDQAVRSQIISSRGGIIKVAGSIFNFPANAVNSDIKVTINKLTQDIPSIPAGFKLFGGVYEITSDKDHKFNKPVTITLLFDPTKIDNDQYDVGLYCWSNNGWVILDQVKVDRAAGKVSGEVEHLSKFTVLLNEKSKTPKPARAETPSLKPAFNDITGHWAEGNIRELVTAGVLSGYPDATFKPDNTITRAEFTSALVKAFKLEARRGRVFNDTIQHWAQDCISTATAHGITSGCDETNFGPDDTITREQMAVMIIRAACLSGGEGKTFADSARISDWAAGAVAAASGKNIIGGFPDNTFRPWANATRAEAVSVIVKALKTMTPAIES